MLAANRVSQRTRVMTWWSAQRTVDARLQYTEKERSQEGVKRDQFKVSQVGRQGCSALYEGGLGLEIIGGLDCMNWRWPETCDGLRLAAQLCSTNALVVQDLTSPHDYVLAVVRSMRCCVS